MSKIQHKWLCPDSQMCTGQRPEDAEYYWIQDKHSVMVKIGQNPPHEIDSDLAWYCTYLSAELDKAREELAELGSAEAPASWYDGRLRQLQHENSQLPTRQAQAKRIVKLTATLQSAREENERLRAALEATVPILTCAENYGQQVILDDGERLYFVLSDEAGHCLRTLVNPALESE